MMIDLGPASARAAATINDVYRQHLELLVLREYAAIESALGTGGLVPLPTDPLRFNIRPRIDGTASIGEKDLDNQPTYLAARPAALGALFDVASRVTSGPVEVTSLVRHSDYQEELRKTNSNANTPVPTHTMGLAFDIAVVNTPLETVREIRNVLARMQADGDILVIGERKQLVFHVVPHPSRLGHFTAVYARRVTEGIPGLNVTLQMQPQIRPQAPQMTQIQPQMPQMQPQMSQMPSQTPHLTQLQPNPSEVQAHPTLHATVSAEIAALSPTPEIAEEWWAAEGARVDLNVEVLPAGVTRRAGEQKSFFGVMASGFAAVLTRMVTAVNGIVA
jgi:hypothetical protein